MLVIRLPADALVPHRAPSRKEDILLVAISLPLFYKFVFEIGGAAATIINDLGCSTLDLILMLLNNLINKFPFHESCSSGHVRNQELGSSFGSCSSSRFSTTMLMSFHHFLYIQWFWLHEIIGIRCFLNTTFSNTFLRRF